MRLAEALHLLAPLVFLAGMAVAQVAPAPAPADDYADVLKYIDGAWDTLTRTVDSCDVVTDPKMPQASVLYLPVEMAASDKLKELEARCKVKVMPLPKRITRAGELDSSAITQHGLLYLEHPYVVPGGMFNEMYGWDSYFIVRGLVLARRVELARGMVENFFFEIEHYGAVLNANRTYYLTRSQPPFLSSMVMAVYDAKGADKEWLARAYDYIQRDHAMWTTAPHLAGDTGLSRYFDRGSGPVPEENETRNQYYHELIGRMIEKPELRGESLVAIGEKDERPTKDAYSIRVCNEADEGCNKVARVAFTADFYLGDRAMRESGFDISFRFAPYGARTHHFAPVCLNSLIYKTEKDLEQIATILGKTADAEKWRRAAAERQRAMQQYLWDERRGMFFDYDFDRKQRSTYEFATTFHPLWAGMAAKSQAASLARNLGVFERAGGLMTSPYKTGVQWDAPYGWAPLQMMPIEGLARYGYKGEADRLARKFMGTIAENFRRDGTIREKYNMETRSSETQITAGYQENVIGFGWTNAAFLVMREMVR